MLEIRNSSGLTLQLAADQRLSVEINSTIFDTDDVIRGSYSYPFKFPLNDNNCRFISFGNLPEVTVSPDLQVSVTSGPHHFKAILNYTVSGNNADAVLLIDLGAVADKIRNTSLREFITDVLLIDTLELPGKVTLISLAEAEPNTFPIVFPPFINPEMIEPDFKPRENYKPVTVSNYFYPDLGIYSHSLAGDGDRLFVPMIYLGWLLTAICAKLEFGVQGSLFTDPELSRLILFNTQTTPGVVRETGQFRVEIGRHLPDLTIAAFFKAIRSYLGLSIDADVTFRKVTINVYNEIRRRKQYLDVTHQQIPGTLGLDKKGPGGYVVKTKILSQDKAINEELIASSFSVGTGEAEIELEVGTCRMAYGPARIEGIDGATIGIDKYNQIKDAPAISTQGRWLIPHVVEPGNLADPFFRKSSNYCPYSDIHEPSKIPPLANDFGLRFLVYWGMKPDSLGNNYPYASSVSYDAQYKVFASLSLQPGEPDDIWTRYQKGYYEFLAFARSINILLRLPISMLSQINPSEIIGLQLKNRVFDRYVFEKLSYELPSMEGYVLAKYEGRQTAPKLIRPNMPEDGIIIGHWVEVRIENKTDLVDGFPFNESAIYPPNKIREVRGDVVLYVWQTGFNTVPVPNSNILVNLKLTKLGLDTHDQQVTTYESDMVTALSDRQVLHTNYLLKSARYLNHMTEIGVERLWILTSEHTFNILPGSGYRSK